jgi:capsular exopolysaccharide synthesis family protein
MPAEVLGSEQMQKLIKDAADCYDYVVIDSPPILAVTDAAILSGFVEGVLLVINSKRTRRVELQQAVKQLREVEAPLIGVVMNRFDSKGDGYGYRYYYRDDDRETRTANKKGG